MEKLVNTCDLVSKVKMKLSGWKNSLISSTYGEIWEVHNKHHMVVLVNIEEKLMHIH
jgi:hypothetical protein